MTALCELLLARYDEDASDKLIAAFSRCSEALRPRNGTALVTLAKLVCSALPTDVSGKTDGLIAFVELVMAFERPGDAPDGEHPVVLQ